MRIGEPLPRAYEAQLERALRPMVAMVRGALSQVTSPTEARALGRILRREWPYQRILEAFLQVGLAAEERASRPWRKLYRAAGQRRDAAEDYDGRALLRRWAREAARTITSVRDDVVEGLAADVADAVERGVDPKSLAKRWRAKGIPLTFGTLEGRVRVIAQHQMGVLQAQVQRERARAIGVTEFVWRTQGDDKVRDEHAALDGTRHAYDDPPSEGLPGQPINCRCYAESVIPDELLGGLGIRSGLGRQ